MLSTGGAPRGARACSSGNRGGRNRGGRSARAAAAARCAAEGLKVDHERDSEHNTVLCDRNVLTEIVSSESRTEPSQAEARNSTDMYLFKAFSLWATVVVPGRFGVCGSTSALHLEVEPSTENRGCLAQRVSNWPGRRC